MTFTRELLFDRHRLSHQQIDDFLQEHESRKFLNEKLRIMMQVREFLEVTELFESANLDYISLKGPLLSYRLYEDTTYRRFNDLDFLMSLKSVNKAIQVLIERGYKPVYYNWPIEKRRQRLVSKHTNQFFLHHPQKSSSIELHWKLFKYHIRDDDTVSRLIAQNINHINYEGRNFSVFNNEFELLYLVIHGGLHAWRRLKWLVDVNEFLVKYKIKEDKFQQLADKLNAERLVTLCNSLLDIYYPGSNIVSTNSENLTFLTDYAISQLTQERDVEYDSVSGFKKYVSFKMKTFPGTKFKLSILKNLMFSVEDIGNNRLPSNTFFFYVYRPFGKLNRWTKKGLVKHN